MASIKRSKHTTVLPILSFDRPIRGLLFIGDPHIWSHKPGRRRDADYLGTLLGKLQWAAEVANRENLLPVVLGDLLHESTDNDLPMISRLVACLQHFRFPPLVLVGNHDITQTTLTPGTVLHLLNQTHVIRAMSDNGPYAVVEMEHESGPVRVLIGATPYGAPIPKSLARWVSQPGVATHNDIKSCLGVEEVVWITHEDLAFDQSYPNALALEPIIGVDYAVNGHMHTTQRPIRKGGTAWYNPGNIARLTIDLIAQTPRVWKWVPRQQKMQMGADGLDVPLLEGLDIPHLPGNEVLSLEGRIAATVAQEAVVVPDATIVASEFVQQLKQDEHQAKTDDGVFLTQSIAEVLDQHNTPPHIRSIVHRLLEKTLIQHRSTE